ncbi:MAG TPA: hypothetical protein IAD07_10910 [Candidatus Fimivicinus intestinavium]|nr:hypothetical protein [Candidatus Fimivicinus intestinavium]
MKHKVFKVLKITGITLASIIGAVIILFAALIGIISLCDNPDWINEEDYKSENFYAGNAQFLDEPAEGAKWSLGYSQKILTPDDLGERPYYMGGYLTIPAKEIYEKFDDMKVRTIVLDDNSGRGKIAFAVIESIGLSNADVRQIRALLADYAAQQNIVSINVLTTHVHSEIDTQGIWCSLPKAIAKNVFTTNKAEKEPFSGRDPAFMQSLFEKTAASIREACESMQPGRMFYAVKKAENYFTDKREPQTMIEEVYRLRFVPDDANAKPTCIVNLSAHPEVTGLTTDNNPGDIMTSDYTAYMEQIINEEGYNFMFFQGAIGGLIGVNRGVSDDGLQMEKLVTDGVTPRHEQTRRWGWEMGKFVSAMTMTEEQILADPVLYDKAQEDKELAMVEDPANYTKWYEDWAPVEETEVEPLLNITLQEVKLPMTNFVFKLVGKMRLIDNTVLKSTEDRGDLLAITEVGYCEIGRQIKVALMPGELNPELAIDGPNMHASGSYSGEEFGLPPMKDMISSGDLLVFGMANDAVGYIIPDNDFGPFYKKDHYEELLSFGKNEASTLVSVFQKLAQK